MTALTERPGVTEEAYDHPRKTIRALTISLVILVVALVGLGAWILYDQNTAPETAISDEVATLLDDFDAAWAGGDGEAFLGMVTADYVMHTGRYGDWDAVQQSAALGDHEFVVAGEAIMIGEGPWYVARVGHLTNPVTPAEGVDGLATFKIVEEGGALKIAYQTFQAEGID